MRTFVIVLLLAIGTLSQQVPKAFTLVQNDKLTAALRAANQQECTVGEFAAASKEIEDHGFLTYAIDARRIQKENAAQYSDNVEVFSAIEEAIQKPGEVVTKTKKPDLWIKEGKIRNIQATVHAILNGDGTLDYYRLEYHLNMEDRQTFPAETYIGAMKFQACFNTREWVQKYFQA